MADIFNEFVPLEGRYATPLVQAAVPLGRPTTIYSDDGLSSELTSHTTGRKRSATGPRHQGPTKRKRRSSIAAIIDAVDNLVETVKARNPALQGVPGLALRAGELIDSTDSDDLSSELTSHTPSRKRSATGARPRGPTKRTRRSSIIAIVYAINNLVEILKARTPGLQGAPGPALRAGDFIDPNDSDDLSSDLTSRTTSSERSATGARHRSATRRKRRSYMAAITEAINNLAEILKATPAFQETPSPLQRAGELIDSKFAHLGTELKYWLKMGFCKNHALAEVFLEMADDEQEAHIEAVAEEHDLIMSRCQQCLEILHKIELRMTQVQLTWLGSERYFWTQILNARVWIRRSYVMWLVWIGRILKRCLLSTLCPGTLSRSPCIIPPF